MPLTQVQGAMWLTQTWTTATRPSSPYTGQMGYNTTFGQIESYNGSSWVLSSAAPVYSVDYLVVAGGGAGGYGLTGSWAGGGGGAGGYREFSSQYLEKAANYTVTVGAGGTAGTVPTSGSNSVFNTITAAGGGRGGGNSTNTQRTGVDGGSGGGGAFNTGGAGNTPSTSPSQGNNGGDSTGGGDQRGGGGGGAGGVGQSGNTGGGIGGVGTASSITGSSVTRAAGGRGGLFGSASSEPAGGANTGNGGGGGGSNAGNGNNGGSGVVIIKYPDIFTITNPGGGLTFSTASSGGFKVTTFTAGTGTIQFN